MAESYSEITTGSGLKYHTFNYTIGANSVHDQGIFLAEQNLADYLLTFGAGGAAVSTATANSHIVQIMAGASLKVRVRRIEVWQAGLATTAALAQLSLVRLTTAGTGGTAQTLQPLDPADAAAGATYMTLPTAKGTEGSFVSFVQPYFMQTAGASAQFNQPFLVWDFDRPRSKPLIIAAGTGNGIALKNQSAVAAATVWVNVWLSETSW